MPGVELDGRERNERHVLFAPFNPHPADWNTLRHHGPLQGTSQVNRHQSSRAQVHERASRDAGMRSALLAHTRSHAPLRAYRRRRPFRLDDVVLAFQSRLTSDLIDAGKSADPKAPLHGAFSVSGVESFVFFPSCRVPDPPRLPRLG